LNPEIRKRILAANDQMTKDALRVMGGLPAGGAQQ
jgi:hypothetical protein